MQKDYQICTNCVMDTTDPEIEFDKNGKCNYCQQYDKLSKLFPLSTEKGKEPLERIVEVIKKRGTGKEFDSVIGLSGGIDSSYAAYKAVEAGLRPLAVHVDGGWNSELAVNNIENLVKKLNLTLHTFVVDWEEMRDLQLAFLKSSVANADVPQDHAFIAALFNTAHDYNIKDIISGINLVTESILPKSWGYTASDLRHIKSIHKHFGSMKLKQFPLIGFFRYFFYYNYVLGIRTFPILNYLTYNKREAMEILKREIGWRDYGGKHHESRFTRFFQAYYLPAKFGYDKRRAHLSSLIVSGQVTREEALEEIKRDLYPENDLREDREFVIKKLNISKEEFENILRAPNKTYKDYPSNNWLFKLKDRISQFKTKVK